MAACFEKAKPRHLLRLLGPLLRDAVEVQFNVIKFNARHCCSSVDSFFFLFLREFAGNLIQSVLYISLGLTSFVDFMEFSQKKGNLFNLVVLNELHGFLFKGVLNYSVWKFQLNFLKFSRFSTFFPKKYRQKKSQLYFSKFLNNIKFFNRIFALLSALQRKKYTFFFS